MNYLLVIDMQNDFIDGALGTKEAKAIVPAVARKIEQYHQKGGIVIFTRDTHDAQYLQTQEGKKLPIPHCIRDTNGWQINSQLPMSEQDLCIDKPTFGSTELVRFLVQQKDAETIEIIGLCTDICVISNAMLVKAALPEVPVSVDAACCAGVTPESHRTALSAMNACQIDIIE